jgi:hypothetical protein
MQHELQSIKRQLPGATEAPLKLSTQSIADCMSATILFALPLVAEIQFQNAFCIAILLCE